LDDGGEAEVRKRGKSVERIKMRKKGLSKTTDRLVYRRRRGL